MRARVTGVSLRVASWIAAFGMITAAGVAVTHRLAPPDDVAPSYICFWAGAKLIVSGQSPYDPTLQAKVQQQYGWNKATDGLGFWDFLPYYYPPSLMQPISVLLIPLGYGLARLTWFILDVESFVLAGYLLSGASTGVAAWVPVVVVPLFAPSLYSMFVGQLVGLILVAIVIAWRLLQNRYDRTAGALLAWMVIKPQLTILFIVGVVLWATSHRRWRVLQGFALGCAAVMAISFAVVPKWPIDLGRALLDQPLPTADRPWAGATWLLVLRTWGIDGWPLWAGYAAVAVPLSMFFIRSALDRTAELRDVIALSLLVAFFIAPYARAYDFPLLLIPLLLLLGGRLRPMWRAVFPTVFIALPFVHLWHLTAGGVAFNFMPQVSLFWIPALLIAAWITTATKPRADTIDHGVAVAYD